MIIIIIHYLSLLGKNHLKAAMHPYDETVRLQMLKKNDNPEYYNLIKEFKKNFWYKCIAKYFIQFAWLPNCM